VPYGQPKPGPSCDLPQIVCDAPRTTDDSDNRFMYPDTLAYMMTNGVQVERKYGCNMQMAGAAIQGTSGTRIGMQPVPMRPDDSVPDAQPNCVKTGLSGNTRDREDLMVYPDHARKREGMSGGNCDSQVYNGYPGLVQPTAESGRRWPQPDPQNCQPWAPGVGDAYRTPGCDRTPWPTEADTHPNIVPGPMVPEGMKPTDKSEGFMGYEVRDPSGEQAWPPGYYAGCAPNRDDPFYGLQMPYKEFENNTDFGTCYAPVSGDYSCDAQRYLDIDAKNVQINKLRGGLRERKSQDAAVSKNSNFYRKNFARELDDYEQKPWWGRQEV